MGTVQTLPAPIALTLPRAGVVLHGDLQVPDGARRLVVFVHGSGSSRRSPRNRRVAARLHDAGLATLLFDLLTPEEAESDRITAALRFDIRRLAFRLGGVLELLAARPDTAGLEVALFGASTGAAAALVVAAEHPDRVVSVVSRGGRPDLAGEALGRVRAPVLLLVGGADTAVLAMNRIACGQLAHGRLEVVPGATHLFEEPGAMDRVVDAAARWFSSPAG
jgi:pimeloyl-ACP methyl ester carboxylesterase